MITDLTSKPLVRGTDGRLGVWEVWEVWEALTGADRRPASRPGPRS
jgi:hypothetical protein